MGFFSQRAGTIGTSIVILLGLWIIPGCERGSDDDLCSVSIKFNSYWTKGHGIAYFTQEKEAGMIYWFLPLTDSDGKPAVATKICPTAQVFFNAGVELLSEKPVAEKVSYELILSYTFEGIFHGIESYPLIQENSQMFRTAGSSFPDIFFVERSSASVKPMMLVKIPYQERQDLEYWSAFTNTHMANAWCELRYFHFSR